jgi:membrane protease subunit (stomatin/prohibitin family)
LHVTLKIFNVLGQEVATLVDGVKEPGYYTVTWNAAEMPSGVYFCRLIAGGHSEMRRMILLR